MDILLETENTLHCSAGENFEYVTMSAVKEDTDKRNTVHCMYFDWSFATLFMLDLFYPLFSGFTFIPFIVFTVIITVFVYALLLFSLFRLIIDISLFISFLLLTL
jgi:hypothetical protein